MTILLLSIEEKEYKHFRLKQHCDIAKISGYKKAIVIVDKDNEHSRKSMEIQDLNVKKNITL